MTAIKLAIEKLKIIDELTDELQKIYESAYDQWQYIRDRINEEVRESHPDCTIDGPEYQKACENNWRWNDLGEMHARMNAAQALVKDLEKLAGIK